MSERNNKKNEIRIEKVAGKPTFILPEIADERAQEFGKNLLNLRLYNAAAKHADNQIKFILNGIRDLFLTFETVNNDFQKLFDGDGMTIEDFQARFPEKFKLPTFENIVRAYENVKELKRQKKEFEQAAREHNAAASDLDFDIAFGETFRQVFDRLVNKNGEPDARDDDFVFPPISGAVSFGLFVRSNVDGRVGRINKFIKSSNNCDVVFDPAQWGIIGAGNVKGEIIGAQYLTIIPDPREKTPHQTAIEFDAAKERATARGRIESGFVELQPDEIIDGDCLTWNREAGMFLTADIDFIGDRAANYYLVIRPTTAAANDFAAQRRQAIKSIPDGFTLCAKDEAIEKGFKIWNPNYSIWNHIESPAEFESVGSYIAVIRPRTLKDDATK